MAFRSIVIENPAHISARNNQLIIRTDTEHSIAIEDISSLLLESRQSTITTAALSQLGQCGCAVFSCDEKHMPCAVLTPFHRHVRELSVLRGQLDATEPRKKQLWRDVVRSKIKNQAVCLQLAGRPEKAGALFRMMEEVRLDILSGGQHHSVSYAIEREIQSLGSALADKAADLLLPLLLEAKQHRYE